MIEFVAPKFEGQVDGDGNEITHVETIYKCYKDSRIADDNLVEEPFVGTKENNGLNVYNSNVLIPRGKTYYATITYMVKAEGSDKKMEAFTTEPEGLVSEETNSSSILAPYTIVEEPQIRVGEKGKHFLDFFLTKPLVRQGVGVHDSTHWIIKSKKGAIIHAKLYDKSNLTSMHIENSKIPDKGEFTIYAAYVMNDGVESGFNVAEFNK